MNLFAKIICTVGLGIGVVFALFYRAHENHPYAGGFDRAFIDPCTVVPLDSVDVQFDSYYISGKTGHHLYLGNIVAPRHLLVVEGRSLDTVQVRFQMKNPDRLKFYGVKVKVDSPYFYMADGSLPAIFQGSLSDGIAVPMGGRPAYFMEFEPVGGNEFVIRSLTKSKEGRLGKLILDPFQLKFPSGLLNKQVDGMFCTEGMLHFDKICSRVVFVYFYRNQYIATDPGLNLLFKGNTIDTVTHAKIDVAYVASSHAFTFSRPPVVVNRQSAVSGRWLFVNSALAANNEDWARFNVSSVIDVYDLDNREYKGSFYIPDAFGKLRHFEIVNDRIIVLYKRWIVAYELPALGDPSAGWKRAEGTQKRNLHVKTG